MPPITRALLSVSDKTGLAGLAQGLTDLGIEIISTGGTAAFLAAQNIPVLSVSDITGFPEMLSGRVKTLHPNIHGALLAVRADPQHMQTLRERSITPIDLAIINLYPFAATISKPGVTWDEAIENIDIGGPAMVRSSAKNHASVGIVTDPADYAAVLQELRTHDRMLQPATLKKLAAKAFRHTSEYDAQITQYLTAHS